MTLYIKLLIWRDLQGGILKGADVDRNMEPLTRKNKEQSRHGGGDGPQGNWII